MEQRDAFLKEFRGETIGTVTSQSSSDESFQNRGSSTNFKTTKRFVCSFF